MNAHFCRVFSLSASSVALVLTLTPTYAAGTTHIREFAKNGSGVEIIVSGDQAVPIGNELQAAILQNPDNKHAPGDVRVETLRQAEAMGLLNNRSSDRPYVFLLVRSELPQTVNPLVATSAVDGTAGPTGSRVVSQFTKSSSGSQVFTVTLVAPDPERLHHVLTEFTKRQRDNFRDLPFSQTYVTNRVAVFSVPEEKADCVNWGRIERDDTWNTIRWYPLSQRSSLSPDALSEFTEMYYIDRERNDAIPDPARAALSDVAIKPGTILAMRTHTPGGTPLVVFSAPNVSLLSAMTHQLSTAPSVPNNSINIQALDLRSVGRTALLVSGGNRDDREVLQSHLLHAMRQDIHIPVEDGSALVSNPDVSVAALADSYRAVVNSGRTPAFRYVWEFQIRDTQGQTKYTTDKHRVTPASVDFPETEPSEPSRYSGLFGTGRKSDDQYNREMRDWRIAHAEWKRKKESYDHVREYLASVQWQRRLLSHSTTHVVGFMHLVDLSDTGASPMWQVNCEGGRQQDGVASSDMVIVAGDHNTPGDLTVPPDAPTSPVGLVQDAALDASDQALSVLRARAWLKTSSHPLIDALVISDSDKKNEPKGADVTEVPVQMSPSEPLVADVSLGVVTLTIGAADGVSVGDKVVVPTRIKQILHPTTGAVLETKVLESVTMRVVRVGKLAECEAIVPADAKKIAQVKLGAPVQWIKGKK